MTSPSAKPIRNGYTLILMLLAASSLALAQDSASDSPPDQAPEQQPAATQQQPATTPATATPGWRRFSKQSQTGTATQQAPANNFDPQNGASDPNTGPPQPDQNQSAPQSQAIPAVLTLKRGTLVTVRVDQMLSSDRNRSGDAFSGTLARPLVVDGIVVAARGQTIAGRVTDAQKAGRVKGVSRLEVRLTDLTLADGTQAHVQSALFSKRGPTSVGRDAGAVGTTTAAGAVIGAAADWGEGAAIGAGAGAAAGVIGVLLTRGRPTVIYPESLLTFRIEAPVSISTTRAPQAFLYMDPNAYDQPEAQAPPRRRPPCEGYGCPPPSYFYGPYGYPYLGPGFSFFYGPRFFHGGRFRRWR
ncbi:MAG TPA: hypothetical protein VG204_13855 [Terriglobia bacterium]|nr:hypothetical protein [Terriglobia bacterium]